MTDYDNWFANELCAVIQAVESQNRQNILTKVAEVRRGIDYASQTPGSITDILIRMAQGLIGPIIVDYGLDRDKKPKHQEQQVNVDELKAAITQRKKEKVVNKMAGSLSELSDFDG
ncbi:MAG: hypothetical protein ACXAC7_00715 [Candidatus Hodarchaeales archaeon]|jgi:hypothetical protein